jgi:hypothetical protein
VSEPNPVGTDPVFILPAWRPGYDWPVSAGAVCRDLRAACGAVPATLDAEAACLALAGSCAIPLSDPDVEAYLFFPNRRYASRAYLREHYPRLVKFLRAGGWLTEGEAAAVEAAHPEPARPPEAARGQDAARGKRARREPAVA